MDFIDQDRFGRPSQMVISDGFKFLGLLVLSAEVLPRRGRVRVDLELVNQEVFKLGITEAVKAKFPEDHQGVA